MGGGARLGGAQPCSPGSGWGQPAICPPTATFTGPKTFPPLLRGHLRSESAEPRGTWRALCPGRGGVQETCSAEFTLYMSWLHTGDPASDTLPVLG